MNQFTVTLLLSLLSLSSVWTARPLGQSETNRQRVPEERPVVPKPKPKVLDVNLMTGVTSDLPAGMTWHSQLTSGSGNCTCDRQGVVKLTVAKGMGAEVNLTFSHSHQFSFHIGDSVTNDGWAGDANTQRNDAEVHSYGQSLFVYGRDQSAGLSYGLVHSRSNYVAVNPHTTVTMRVADELVTADNGLTFLYLNSHKLFALRGQDDVSSGGVNQDLYLAMNRVVSPRPDRTGSGLCRVSVRFYPVSP